jgi:hypothetical protein
MKAVTPLGVEDRWDGKGAAPVDRKHGPGHGQHRERLVPGYHVRCAGCQLQLGQGCFSKRMWRRGIAAQAEHQPEPEPEPQLDLELELEAEADPCPQPSTLFPRLQLSPGQLRVLTSHMNQMMSSTRPDAVVVGAQAGRLATNKALLCLCRTCVRKKEAARAVDVAARRGGTQRCGACGLNLPASRFSKRAWAKGVAQRSGSECAVRLQCRSCTQEAELRQAAERSGPFQCDICHKWWSPEGFSRRMWSRLSSRAASPTQLGKAERPARCLECTVAQQSAVAQRLQGDAGMKTHNLLCALDQPDWVVRSMLTCSVHGADEVVTRRDLLDRLWHTAASEEQKLYIARKSVRDPEMTKQRFVVTAFKWAFTLFRSALCCVQNTSKMPAISSVYVSRAPSRSYSPERFECTRQWWIQVSLPSRHTIKLRVTV